MCKIFGVATFLDKLIDRHNFKLNSWSPAAGFFSIGKHMWLKILKPTILICVGQFSCL